MRVYFVQQHADILQWFYRVRLLGFLADKLEYMGFGKIKGLKRNCWKSDSIKLIWQILSFKERPSRLNGNSNYRFVPRNAVQSTSRIVDKG